MNNQDVMRIAMEQSAIDSGCRAADFLDATSKVVLSQSHPDARKYLTLPFACDLTSYGNGVVASVSAELVDAVECYLQKYGPVHCFETPSLHSLSAVLLPFDLNVCFMAEYFLPDVRLLKPLSCGYTTRVLQPQDFADCYLPQWDNALCEGRRQRDVLAVGAYHADRLVGLAGCSADCDTMWQIGVDVLPEYQRQGIAAALTSRLALEALERGRVPFYCCAWSNIKSVRNAIASGFRPAWVQVTAKKNDFIAEMNR